MNKPFGNADPTLEDYTTSVFAPEDPFLADVRQRLVHRTVIGVFLGLVFWGRHHVLDFALDFTQ